MQETILSPRLLWIAERVRENVLFADVGTDHAKLPVYLLQSGRISRTIASDIHRGPLEKARVYINACGFGDSAELVLTDGLEGLKITSPCDIAICGMGGETIKNIIDAAAIVKCEGIRLLLQPMTDFALLRSYLSENGFAIIDEDIVFSDDREYQCIIAEYTGENYTMTPIEYELGAMCIEKRGKAFYDYVMRKSNMVKAVIEGKSRANLDTSEEKALLAAYETILEDR